MPLEVDKGEFMVSLQDKLRALDAELSEGRLSPADHMRLRAEAVDAIPEVREVTSRRPVPFWPYVIAVTGALVTLTALIAFALDDAMLALTLCVTVLAAITVAAWRKLDP